MIVMKYEANQKLNVDTKNYIKKSIQITNQNIQCATLILQRDVLNIIKSVSDANKDRDIRITKTIHIF
jgi:hypothetical protein